MSTQEYHLHEKIFVQGTITTLSGLLIGGSDTALAIGGLSKTVVRDPATGKPYIPGSSFKGKLRSLTELSQGKLGGPAGSLVKHGPSMDPKSHGAQLFGNAINGKKVKPTDLDPDAQRPSPLIVRDAYLLQDKPFPHADLGYTHTKTEVCLDRLTAKANPRTVERVPPGAQFELSLVLNIFQERNQTDQDRETHAKKLMNLLYQALQLLQDDYMGGGGSRGNGQISIQIDQVFSRDMAWYTQPNPPQKGGNDATDRFPIPTVFQPATTTVRP